MHFHTEGSATAFQSSIGGRILEQIRQNLPNTPELEGYFTVGSTGYINMDWENVPPGFRGWCLDEYQRVVAILGPYILFQRMRLGDVVMIYAQRWRMLIEADEVLLSPYLGT